MLRTFPNNPPAPVDTSLPGRGVAALGSAPATPSTAVTPPVSGPAATPSTPFTTARANGSLTNSPIQTGLGGRNPNGASGNTTVMAQSPPGAFPTTPAAPAPQAPQNPVLWTPQNGVSFVVQPGDPRYDQAVASGNTQAYNPPTPNTPNTQNQFQQHINNILWGGNPNGMMPSQNAFGNSFSPTLAGYSPSYYGQSTTNPNTVNNFGNSGQANILSALMSIFGGNGLLSSLLGGQGNSSFLSGY